LRNAFQEESRQRAQRGAGKAGGPAKQRVIGRGAGIAMNNMEQALRQEQGDRQQGKGQPCRAERMRPGMHGQHIQPSYRRSSQFHMRIPYLIESNQTTKTTSMKWENPSQTDDKPHPRSGLSPHTPRVGFAREGTEGVGANHKR